MNHIIRTLRRLRPGRLQIVGDPIVDITLADIMHDLDPYWGTTDLDNHAQYGGTR